MPLSPGGLRGWVERVGAALGATGPARALGGSAWRLMAGGVPVVAKVAPGAADEAAGLRVLAAVAGAPAVPEVLLCDGDLLVTSWVDQAPATAAHHERLGAGLAALHSATAGAWGGGSGWIGRCRVDPRPDADGPRFYGRRLVDLAARCGLGAEVEPVAARLGDLAPWPAPAPLHGDLWWGNVLWGADGGPWLVDPSQHGGHPEEDLAMLALFGDVPVRALAAYSEVRPLDGDWERRVGLWQLYPLLVHAVLFGGAYRSRAAAVARHYGGPRS